MFKVKWSISKKERIWAWDHANAPVARTGSLLEAEEDHRCQLREGQHESAQVTADADVVVARTHFLNDVINVRWAIVLAQPRPCWGDAPQWHRTLLTRHGNPAKIWNPKREGIGISGIIRPKTLLFNTVLWKTSSSSKQTNSIN